MAQYFNIRDKVVLPDGTKAIFEAYGPLPGDTTLEGVVTEMFCSVLIGDCPKKLRKIILLKDVKKDATVE